MRAFDASRTSAVNWLGAGRARDADTSTTDAASRVSPGAALARRGRRPIVILLLIFADVAALEISLFLVASALGAVGVAAADLVHALALAAPFLVLLGWGAGLYDCRRTSPFERFRQRVRIVAVYFGSASMIAVLSPSDVPNMLALAPLAAAATIALGWWAEAGLRRALEACGMWGTPVLVLGAGPASRALAARLRAEPEHGLRPIGLLRLHEDELSGGAEDVPVLGGIGDASDLMRLAEGAIAPKTVADALVVVGSFDALPFARLSIVRDDGEVPAACAGTRGLEILAEMDLRRGSKTAPQRWAKRSIDLAVALPLLVLSLPVILVTALAIKAVSPGAAFYTQRRVGHGGEPLLVPKLRSMHPDAERRLKDHLARDPRARAEWERYVKLSEDPRILPLIGTFIRRTSVDELPQLWNIVRGDMSLVGPRPFPAYHVDRFDADFQSLRTTVPPGLTGLWQVSCRSDGDLDRQKEQDSLYIRNWSLLLDAYILLQTIPAVLFAKGAK